LGDVCGTVDPGRSPAGSDKEGEDEKKNPLAGQSLLLEGSLHLRAPGKRKFLSKCVGSPKKVKVKQASFKEIFFNATPLYFESPIRKRFPPWDPPDSCPVRHFIDLKGLPGVE